MSDNYKNNERDPVFFTITLFPEGPDEGFTPVRRISFFPEQVESSSKLNQDELLELFSSRLASRLKIANCAKQYNREVNLMSFECADVLCAEAVALGFIQQAFGPKTNVFVSEKEEDGEFGKYFRADGAFCAKPVTVMFLHEGSDKASKTVEIPESEVVELLESVPAWSVLLPGEAAEMIAEGLAKKYRAAGYTLKHETDLKLLIELIVDNLASDCR